jgi:serine phosphatase RsbU (regulator of sigma subunit)
MLAEAEHPMAEADLRPGDLLLLFTDGVIEAEDDGGEQFSIARLQAFLCAWGDRPVAGLGEELLRELRRFTGRAEFVDDLTFIAVRVL